MTDKDPSSKLLTNKRALDFLGFAAPAHLTVVADGNTTVMWDGAGSSAVIAGPAASHVATMADTRVSSLNSSVAPPPSAWPGAAMIDDTSPMDGEGPSDWWRRVGAQHGWAEWVTTKGLTGDKWAEWAKVMSILDPSLISVALQEKLDERADVPVETSGGRDTNDQRTEPDRSVS